MLLSACSKYEEFNGGEFDLYLRSGDIYSVSNDEDGSVFNPDGTGYERTNAIPSTLFSWEQKKSIITITNKPFTIGGKELNGSTFTEMLSPLEYKNGLLLSTTHRFKGKVPDGNTFNATVSLALEKSEYKSTDTVENFTFHKDGTFTLDCDEWTDGGTYTRDGSFILLRFNDSSSDYDTHLVVVDKTLYSSFYIPSENGIPDLFK